MTLQLWNNVGLTFSDSVSDGFGVSSSATAALAVALTDGLYTFDALKFGWTDRVADGFDVSETLAELVGLVIAENLRMSEQQTVTGAYAHSAADAFHITGALTMRKLFRDTVAESLGMSDNLTELFSMLVREMFGVEDAAACIGAFQQTAADGFSLADALGFLTDLLIEDGFSATDAATLRWVLYSALADGFGVADDAAGVRGFFETLAETVDLGGAVTAAQVLGLLIADGFNFEIELEYEGEVWTCLALNTDKLAPSVYSNYGFNSFCVYEGAAYGAKADGIYKLEGDDDAGTDIRAGIVFTETLFGTHLQKRIRTARFGMSGTAPVVRFTADGEYRDYTVERQTLNPARDQKGLRWSIRLSDFDAVDFVEIAPVLMTR